MLLFIICLPLHLSKKAFFNFFLKFLADILSPLQNCNGLSVPNSSKCADEISNIDIQDKKIMLSFDAVSLFTAIPSKTPVITFKINWTATNHYIYVKILSLLISSLY